MKRLFYIMLVALLLPIGSWAQGWPENYGGVMLQGFYWDSFRDSKWTRLEKQATDMKGYFDLVWVPQSGKCLNSRSMGYDIYYYFNQNSSFGTEAELRSMISTFKANGIGAVADIVVNHRNTDGWWSFPAETYKGQTYQMTTTDIVADDDNYKTATQAKSDGVTLSSNNDEGQGWDGMRDLDHKSQNVKTIVNAYLDFLKNDIGYTGFRYDVAKGFGGQHVGDYNSAAGITYSVGEYWDGNSSLLKNWIDATGKRSAAFDFAFRYNVRDAANNNNWAALNSTNNLVSSDDYRRYAVTFIENHDTEYRSSAEQQDPIRRDTLAANAYMLAMPGTPCVFYKHYLAYPEQIKAMIDVRKAMEVNNQSTYKFTRSASEGVEIDITTGNRILKAVIGSNAASAAPGSRWTEVASGYHYKYFVYNNAKLVFADKPSGSYTAAFGVKLAAATAASTAKIVYTLDGTEPSATNGTTLTNGASVSITENCTLRAILLLADGTIASSLSRTYTFTEPEQETFETPAEGYTYTAYFIAPTSWDADTEVYAWAWNDTNKSNYTPDNNASWPGDSEHVYRIGKAADGGYIWQWCYYGTLTTAPEKIIFNNGDSGVGTNQTDDMTFTDGGWYNMSTTKSDPTLGINGVTPQPSVVSDAWYTLSGQRVTTPTAKGVYIHNGKKVIIR